MLVIVSSALMDFVDYRRAAGLALVSRAPGRHLVKCLAFLMPAKWIQRRVEPTYLDELDEYCADLAEGRKVRAQLVRVRLHLRILWVIAVSIGVGALGHFLKEVFGVFRTSD